MVGGGLTEASFGPAGWTLPIWWPLLLAALAALGVYTAFHGLALRLTRTRYQERLARYVYEPAGAASRAAQAKLNPHAKMRPLVLSLARLTHRLLPARMLDELRRRLVLAAGRPAGTSHSSCRPSSSWVPAWPSAATSSCSLAPATR